MFVPVVVRLPTSLVRVKTAARFTAEDPWNSNYPAQFTVDDYLVGLRGSRSLPETTHEPRWMGAFHRALHSQPSGAVRLLPESLIELWLNEEVPIEALPRLLKAIEPTLKRGDYRPILHNSFMKIGATIETLICIALELIAIFVVIMEHLPLPLAIAISLGIAFILWGFLYLLYFGKIRRRRRQMSQIRSLLAPQAEPISPTMAEP